MGFEHYVLAVKLKREKVPSFDVFPFALPALRHLHSLELHPSVTFVVGENGSGKSTLLEAIAVAAGFNAEGGTKNFRFHTRRSHSSLHECLTLVKSLTEMHGGTVEAENARDGGAIVRLSLNGAARRS